MAGRQVSHVSMDIWAFLFLLLLRVFFFSHGYSLGFEGKPKGPPPPLGPKPFDLRSFWNGSLPGSTMLEFYQQHWRPLGKLLSDMEFRGMPLDEARLAELVADTQVNQDRIPKAFQPVVTCFRGKAKCQALFRTCLVLLGDGVPVKVKQQGKCTFSLPVVSLFWGRVSL